MRTVKNLLLIVVLTVAGACTATDREAPEIAGGVTEPTIDTDDAAADDDSPTAEASVIAVARAGEIEVFGDPDATAVSNTIVGEPDYPLTFAVVDRTDDMVWVHLPTRPNGATGWVRAADVQLSVTDYRIEIDLSEHTLVVTERGETVMQETVAVGTADNPTPTGQFYVYELLQPHAPDGPYGQFAFGLSGHSDQLTEFAGGDGRIGIHGTNQPELLGTDASHGCTRMSNDAIAQLATLIPLGTPVDIHA